MPASKKLVTPRGLKKKPKQAAPSRRWWLLAIVIGIVAVVLATKQKPGRRRVKKTTKKTASVSERWAEAVSKGDKLNRQGKFDLAEEAYLSAIAIDPKLSPAYTNLAGVLAARARFQEAVGNASRAFGLSQTSTERSAASINLGLSLRGELKEQSALAAFLAGRQADNSSVDVRIQASASALALGALDIARDCAEEAFALGKVATSALVLARLGNDDVLDADETAAARLFSNFEIYHRMGQVDAAWESVVAANRAALEELPKKRRDVVQEEAKTTIAMARAVVEEFQWSPSEEEEEGAPSTMPLFVVGPPRTGTTLVAAALSRHSKVDLTLAPRINDAIARYGPGPFRDNNRTILDPLRDAYLHTSENKYVLESYPENIWWLGAAAIVFQGRLRVVLLSRDRDQVAFSCYKTFFEHSLRDWTNDPVAIRNRLDAYQLLSEGAQDYGFVKRVEFDTLVEKRQDTINGILDFLHLEREEDCLDPANNPMPFYTPANLELRQQQAKSDYTWTPYSTLLQGVSDS